MLTQSDLERLVPAALIAEAQNAMDALSITNFKYDTRGRLEAGVKPAPPSKEGPAFVRITRRGSNLRVDCRVHGKNTWCIHAVILALHHLGKAPTYRHIKPPTAPALPTAKVGYQWQVRFGAEAARFRLFALSTRAPLRQSLKQALIEAAPPLKEQLEDLAEELEAGFDIARLDLAQVLHHMDEGLLHLESGHPLTYARHSGDFPTVEARIHDNAVLLDWSEAVADGAVLIPGRPGYLYHDGTLTRFSGYVPDLQKAAGRHRVALNAGAVAALLREKHGLRWRGLKPERVVLDDAVHLRLQPDGRDLQGVLGFLHRGVFLPLHNRRDARQLIRLKDRMILLEDAGHTLPRIDHHALALRLPWNKEGSSFRIREGGAGDFLRNFTPPDRWSVTRDQADDWFGLTYQDTEVSWEGLKPRYKIGDAWFDHADLLGRMLDNGLGARLADGRTLHFDGKQVQKNQALLTGVQALHDDPTKAETLLARLRGDGDAEPVEVIELSATWQETLRPYQEEGVRWMLTNFARHEPMLLADDMGLGKTVQTLAFLDAIREDLPQLIVVPTALTANWRKECGRFSPHRKVTLHHGPNRATDPAKLAKADLVITTYGTLRRDVDLLYDVNFQIAVLDEAQAIKNPRSQVSQAAAELWTDARLALTGTPIENRLTELWSVFRFLAPGYLGEEDTVKSITVPGTAAYEALKIKVKPFLKRRLKSEVEPDLPEKQEVVIDLPLDERQNALYQVVLKDARTETRSQKGKPNTMSILTKLLRLRQICCHPGLVDDTRLTTSSNKFDFILEHLVEIRQAGHAALVFSQFTQLLQLLRFQLEEADLDCLYLDGATRDRQGLVDRFQDGEGDVFLISLKAGGTGLNLTRASYVYHLDPWWNPAVEAQATDRAHRIGQTQKVFSYKLISSGTVEEKILKLQKKKKFLAEGLWHDADTLAAQMDRETMLELLT